jgi:hypothetical protein
MGKTSAITTRIHGDVKGDLELINRVNANLNKLRKRVVFDAEQGKIANEFLKRSGQDELSKAIAEGHALAAGDKEKFLNKYTEPVLDESGKQERDGSGNPVLGPRTNELTKCKDEMFTETKRHVEAMEKQASNAILFGNPVRKDLDKLRKADAFLEELVGEIYSKSWSGHASAAVSEAMGRGMETSVNDLFANLKDVDVTEMVKQLEYHAVAAAAFDGAFNIINAKKASGTDAMNAVADGIEFLQKQNFSDFGKVDTRITSVSLQKVMDEIKNPPVTAKSKEADPINNEAKKTAETILGKELTGHYKERKDALIKEIDALEPKDKDLDAKLEKVNAEMVLLFGELHVLTEIYLSRENQNDLYSVQKAINAAATQKAKELKRKVVEVKPDEAHKKELREYLNNEVAEVQKPLKDSIMKVYSAAIESAATAEGISKDEADARARAYLDEYLKKLEALWNAKREAALNRLAADTISKEPAPA